MNLRRVSSCEARAELRHGVIGEGGVGLWGGVVSGTWTGYGILPRYISYPRDRREAVFAALGGWVLGYGSSIYRENWKL